MASESAKKRNVLQTKVSVVNEFNIQKSYHTEHACVFGKFKGKFCNEKLSELRSELSGQQSFLFAYYVIRYHWSQRSS
jgi:hypothetical protein